ncbi:hypothetical protein EGW08_014403 [Elysia chlorotica]|uniref:Sfi1 spindle body domain-containing protein n=1 Tax=Elysia chlorotica TaxID=188477 RepID=A0A433T8A9_ELYCH|nr:hypothetical protein EGW08_014403 [Elysia chlorotica]
MAQKAEMADQMRDFILTKRCFLNWRHYKYHQHFLERRAQKHHAGVVKVKAFLAWAVWTREEREETRRAEEEAAERYTRWVLVIMDILNALRSGFLFVLFCRAHHFLFFPLLLRLLYIL